jgi:hypothetical protein
MASVFQGFDRNLNLSENIADRDVLNNLGGAPIADDITLFLNNLRNKSELIVTSSQIQGSFIRFDPNIRSFVYTNGTKITIGPTEYFVGDSNGINEFRLYTNSNLTTLVANPPTGTYTRSNAVTFDDIQNLVRFRNPVIEDVSLSNIIGTDTDLSSEETNIFSSFIRVYRSSVISFPTNLSSYLTNIENELNLFDLNKKTSLNSLRDFASESPLSLSGNIFVSDPSGTNNTTVSSTSGPGIFILDPETDNAARIFSSNENVWTESGDDLVAASKEILVGNFVFDQQAKILRKSSQPTITSDTAVITTFTHFVNVVVNGEEYSLCLK